MEPLYPTNVTEIVKKIAAKHPSDIGKAADEALVKLATLQDFQSTVVPIMLRQAVVEIIQDLRCSDNRSIKSMSSGYRGAAKVNVGTSRSAQAAASALYALNIDGRQLGMLYGRDLPELAAKERGRADGHTQNAYRSEERRVGK